MTKDYTDSYTIIWKETDEYYSSFTTLAEACDSFEKLIQLGITEKLTIIQE